MFSLFTHSYFLLTLLGEETTVSEKIALGRGTMIASRQGGTCTVTATIAEEAAAAATVAVAAGAGAKTVSETATEKGTGRETEIETETEIVPGAGPSAELGREAGAEVRT